MKVWSIDRDTRLLISASAAPSQFGVTVYNALFRSRGVNAVYVARRATDAAELVRGIRALGVAGASVSMPLKHAIVSELDEVEGDASVVRSVNTVVNVDGSLVGHNTDVAGFRGALAGVDGRPEVLVEGSGSVVDSILHVLAERGWSAALRGRNTAAVEAKCQRWGVRRYTDGPVQLWVNATPLSMSPLSDATRAFLQTQRPRVLDLVVPLRGNHLATACSELGLDYRPGFVMYQHQFVRQFELYTGLRVTPDEVRQIAVEHGLV